MNEIVVRGYLRDIEYSHNQGDIEYEKANLICPRTNGKEEDIISLKYKKFVNKYEEGDFIELKGNLRSYSTVQEGKNSVQIYVFTYFDSPDEISTDNVRIDGRICSMDTLRQKRNGLNYIHFTLANNIFTNNGKKLNNYIPCTAYGELAEQVAELYVNDFLDIAGEFHSHTFKKRNDNGDIEFRVAHEVVLTNFRKVDN